MSGHRQCCCTGCQYHWGCCYSPGSYARVEWEFPAGPPYPDSWPQEVIDDYEHTRVGWIELGYQGIVNGDLLWAVERAGSHAFTLGYYSGDPPYIMHTGQGWQVEIGLPSLYRDPPCIVVQYSGGDVTGCCSASPGVQWDTTGHASRLDWIVGQWRIIDNPCCVDSAVGVIHPWQSTFTYAAGDYVEESANAYYRSLQDNNTGHTPSTSPEWWVRIYPCSATASDSCAGGGTGVCPEEGI